MPATPISMASHTIGFVNGYDSMFVKPNMRPPKPKMDKPTEKKSAFADVSRVPKLCKPKIATNSEITPMIVKVRKIERQPFTSVCKPPSVGPIAGATLMAMPTVPIAMPRRDNGYIEKTVICRTGHITPPPMASSIRPISTSANVGPSQANMEPIVNTVMEAITIWRVEKRRVR